MKSLYYSCSNNQRLCMWYSKRGVLNLWRQQLAIRKIIYA